MIVGLVGNLGRGKTLGMTMLGHYMYYNTHYERVVSNYRTDLTTDYIENPVQFDEISQNVDGIYLLDEVWAWADSRKSQENDLMNEVVINSRKRGAAVVYTVQSVDMVDKRLRNNTDYFGICRHYEGSEVGSSHDVAKILLFNKHGEHVNTFTYNAEMYYGTYDTTEEVATKSAGDMYKDLIREHKKDVKADKFQQKNELESHLKLEHDLSRAKAEDVTNEVFRSIRNEENVLEDKSDENDEFEKPESSQKELEEALS